jgi:hypothetical protein
VNKELQTLGISPKTVAAFVFPAIAAIGAAVVSWVSTGNFSATEIRTAVGGVIAAAIAALGAYLGKPGPVK